jgi:hypothetical protein
MLSVILKDRSFGDAKMPLVTLSNVSVHVAGGDFFPLPAAPRLGCAT